MPGHRDTDAGDASNTAPRPLPTWSFALPPSGAGAAELRVFRQGELVHRVRGADGFADVGSDDLLVPPPRNTPRDASNLEEEPPRIASNAEVVGAGDETTSNTEVGVPRSTASRGVSKVELDLDVQTDAGDDAPLLPGGCSGASVARERLRLVGFHTQALLNALRRLDRVREDDAQDRDAKERRAVEAADALAESYAARPGDALPADLVAHMMEVGLEEHLKLLRRLILGEKPAYGVDVVFRDLTVKQDVVTTVRRKRGATNVVTAALDVAFAPCLAVRRELDRRSREAAVAAHRKAGADANADAEDPTAKLRLRGVSGACGAGTMTLLLGPPQAGKTTLLHALAGRLTTLGARHVSGTVTYNGHPSTSVRPTAFCTVVEQTDLHIATLTVRETIAFAHACRGLGAAAETMRHSRDAAAPGPSAAALAAVDANKVELVMAVLGLLRCADTPVGNNVIKGISGGEMRRLTLAEMLVAGSKVLLLDEVSTGLDSAAALEITRAVRTLCRVFCETAIVALLQPPPEVLALFDDVCVLSRGRVAYHGPRADMQRHFEALGFAIPERRGDEPAVDLADFVIEVCGADVNEVVPATFGTSPAGAAMRVRVDAPPKHRGHPLDELVLNAPVYQRPWLELLRLLVRRQLTCVLRNFSFIRARVVMNLVLSLVLGLTFFQISFGNVWVVAMIFLQLLMFSGFSTMALLNDIVAGRNVLYKQANERFFSPSVFVVADLLAAFPFTLFDAFFLCTVLYFMAGLSIEPGVTYLVFLLITLSFGVAMAQLGRVFAYASRDTNEAHGYAIFFIMLSMMYSGVRRRRRLSPPPTHLTDIIFPPRP